MVDHPYHQNPSVHLAVVGEAAQSPEESPWMAGWGYRGQEDRTWREGTVLRVQGGCPSEDPFYNTANCRRDAQRGFVCECRATERTVPVATPSLGPLRRRRAVDRHHRVGAAGHLHCLRI